MKKYRLSFVLITIISGLLGCSGNRAPAGPSYLGQWGVTDEAIDAMTADMKQVGKEDKAMSDMMNMYVEKMEKRMASMVLVIETNAITTHSIKGEVRQATTTTKIDEKNYRFTTKEEGGPEMYFDLEIVDADHIIMLPEGMKEKAAVPLTRLNDTEAKHRFALAKEGQENPAK